MFKHRVALLLASLFILFAQSAQAFIDPPYVTPAAPAAGEVVSVNVRTGVCDAILNVQELTSEGNAIRILFFGVRYFDSELCWLPVWTTTESVGAYPPGSYTLQVDLAYGSVGGILRTDTLGIVPFTVSGPPAPPVPAPINAPVALLLMLLVMALLATRTLRARGPMWLLVVAIGLSPSVRARDATDNVAVQLLLTTAPGAPTPEQLVSYHSQSRGRAGRFLRLRALGAPFQPAHAAMACRAARERRGLGAVLVRRGRAIDRLCSLSSNDAQTRCVSGPSGRTMPPILRATAAAPPGRCGFAATSLMP